MNSDTHIETRPVRVLLADHPVLTRRALRRLIEAGESFRVVAEASTVDEIAEHARRSAVDVIVIDFGMPGIDELETLPWHGRPAAPATVLIAHHQGVTDLERALRIGAYGYVTTNDEPDVLYLALQQAASGRSFLSPHVTRTVLDSLTGSNSHTADTARPWAVGSTPSDQDMAPDQR